MSVDTTSAASSPEEVVVTDGLSQTKSDASRTATVVSSAAGRTSRTANESCLDTDPQTALCAAFAAVGTSSVNNGKKMPATSPIFTLPENLTLAAQSSEFRYTTTSPACGVVSVAGERKPASRVGISASGTASGLTRSSSPAQHRGVAIDSPCVSFPQARRSSGSLDLSEASDADLRRIADAWPLLPRSVRSAIIAIVCSVSAQGDAV